jgi:hypothetical protein
MAMKLRHCKFIPADPSDTCFSIFLTAPIHTTRHLPNRQCGLSPAEWELGLQGNSALSLDTVRELLQISIHACTKFHDAILQMRNFHSLLAVLFGMQSEGAKAMLSIIQELQLRSPFMEEAAHHDSNLMPGILQCIKHLFVNYFRACSRCSSLDRPPSPNIEFFIMRLQNGDSFSTTILDPAVRASLQLATPTNSGLPNDERTPGTDNNNRGERTQTEITTIRNNPSHPGHNPQLDPQLHLNARQFAFASNHNSRIPNFNGSDTETCMNYHLRGACRHGSNCLRAASHGLLTTDCTQAIRQWLGNIFPQRN